MGNGSQLLGVDSSYEQAVKTLFDSIDRGRQPIDLIAPPLLFLMRHSMELGYKYAIWEIHQITGEKYDAEAYGKHDLAMLHAALREQHQKVVVKMNLPDSEVENFEHHCVNTEAGMKKFMAMDSGSFSFRYPIDKKGNINFRPDETVDLVAMKLLYDDAMILLCATADVLDQYVEIESYWARDFSP
jgi:hypothetical protein